MGGVMIIAVTALVIISVLVCVMRRRKKEKETGNDWLCHLLFKHMINMFNRIAVYWLWVHLYILPVVSVPLATDVIYDEITLPSSSAAVIPTKPNSAYATVLQRKPPPPIITVDNVAYSIT